MSVLSSKDSFKRIDLDGLNLTASSDSNISLDASTTIPLKFVYVGTGGNVQSAISTDAVTWTENQSAFGTDNNPRVPVVANSDSTLLYTTSTYSDYISTDGLSWTINNVPMQVSGATGYSIYANGKFVVVYENSMSPYVRSSTDAVTWTVSTTPAYGQYMAYGNGKYLYYSQPNASIVTSTDAITWTETPHTSMTGVFARIMFVNNKFIRHSGSYYYYESSTDGVSWTEGFLPPTQYSSYSGMAYGNNLYLALSFTGDIVSSTDLITWSSLYSGLPYGASLSFVNGKFYATAEDSSSIYSSTNGVTWLQSSKPSYTSFSAVGGNLVGTGININSSGISTTADISARKFIGDGSELTGLASDGVTLSGTEALTNKTITSSTFKGTIYDTLMNSSGNQGSYLSSDGMNGTMWSIPTVNSTIGTTTITSDAPNSYSVNNLDNVTINNTTIPASSTLLTTSTTSINGTTIPATSTLATTSNLPFKNKLVANGHLETIPRIFCTTTANSNGNSNVQNMAVVVPTENITVSKVAMHSATGQSSGTLRRFVIMSLNAAGNQGTIVGITANDTTIGSASNTYYSRNLLSPVTLNAGTPYAIGIVTIGQTGTISWYGIAMNLGSFTHGYANDNTSFPFGVAAQTWNTSHAVGSNIALDTSFAFQMPWARVS